MKILLFLSILLHKIKSRRKDNSSDIYAHGIYRSVKDFLQPIKLHEISIMMRSWNSFGITLRDLFSDQHVRQYTET